MRKLFLIASVVGLVLAAVGCKVVSTPAAPVGWGFLNESPSGGHASGFYVNGPGDPPAGRGSALITLDGTGREAIATGAYSGLPLSTIHRLEYSTYQAFAGSPSETLYLQFDVDYDSTDSSTAYQGRLVFVPSEGGTVHPKEWQTWDTMVDDSWYSSASGDSDFRPIVDDVEQEPICTQNSSCTWDDILDNYPNARVRPNVNGIPGAFMVRAGGPATGGFVGATDNVIVGFGSTVVEHNFEPGDGNVVINTANAAARGFAFVQETATGSGAFVNGPNGADNAGSAELTLNADGGEALLNGLYSGTPFDTITFLSYKTYQPDPTPNATTLQLDADYDDTDGSTAFQGRVVFEPSQSGQAAVTSEVWQTWNPLRAPSGWWQTGTPIVGGAPTTAECTQGSPCSFDELLTEYPDLAISPITNQVQGQPIGGGIRLKAGGGWGNWTGNVDSLAIAVDVGGVNATSTYDFEP